MRKNNRLNGLDIIYEDRDIIVINKKSGLLTIATEKEKINTAHYILNDYVRKGNSKSRERVYIVHRLDRETSGLLVFAKTEKSKHFLQENWSGFQKKYVAIVHGTLTNKHGIIESYLMENSACRVHSTSNTAKGKYAKTEYTVIKETDKLSMLEINLYTGRKNQIRVHMSDLGHPIVGDKVYGKADKIINRMALHSSSLQLIHPFTKKELSFKAVVPNSFAMLFK